MLADSMKRSEVVGKVVDITIKPGILRELCPTSKSRVAPRDTPWRPLSLSKFRHNGHTSTPSKEFFFVAYYASTIRVHGDPPVVFIQGVFVFSQGRERG